MSCGHLLTQLYSSQSFKVVPNPPGTIQTAIDKEIKAYQNILDEIDVEIQLSRRYLRNAMEEKKRRIQESLEKQKNEQLGSKGSLGGNINGDEQGNASACDGENSGNMDELIDSNAMFDDLFESKDDPVASLNNGGEPIDGDDSERKDIDGNLGDFDGDQFASLDAFEDLSALLGGANNDNKNPGNNTNNNGLDDENMGGLFGDNFDFILPGT